MRLAGPACMLIVVAACAGPRAPSPELPEIAAFRAALADPARHPLRNGLELDQAQLGQAIARFRDENRALLEKTFRASLDALPAGAAPADGYGVVAETQAADSPGLVESTGFLYALHPDVTHLARMAINMFAPILAREAGMSIASVGTWIAFFGSAAPALRRCGADPVLVCVDYGGLDVFVVTLAPRGSSWAVSAVSWKQRGRSPR